MGIDWILFVVSSFFLSVIVVFVIEEAYTVFVKEKSKPKDNKHV